MKKRFIFVSIIIILVSCTSQPKHLIPEDEFINLMADIHINDAIMNEEGFVDKTITYNDSASYYNFLYKKYNISREDFKENLEYYSTDIENFILIYDRVMIKLNEMKNQIDSLESTETTINEDTLNLWPLLQIWNLPYDGETEPIKYSIDTEKHGTYTLSADIKFYLDDGTISQRMSIFANYSDGSYDSNSNGTMQKDGQWKNYKVSIQTDKNKELKSISGWLLDHSEGTKEKHVEVKNIDLRFFPD